jgi:hypothetical protein
MSLSEWTKVTENTPKHQHRVVWYITFRLHGKREILYHLNLLRSYNYIFAIY